MNPHSLPLTSRRDFLKERPPHGRVRVGGDGPSARSRVGEQHHSGRLDRLWRSRHGRGLAGVVHDERADQAGRAGGCLREPRQQQLRDLKQEHTAQVDVPRDRRFVGFDGYQKAMDCLKPGDVAIFATPPAFRWVHFAYAIQKG